MELRKEIIESQKVRADLFKWKIILVAAIGAGVLGVTDPFTAAAPKTAEAQSLNVRDYLLCLIPLVCVYTDALCLHLNLRIMVIGSFIRQYRDSGGSGDLQIDKKYEQFVQHAREKVGSFLLEDVALWITTVVMSFFVLAWGLLNLIGYIAPRPQWEPWALIASGLVGLIATRVLFALYRQRQAKITSLPGSAE